MRALRIAGQATVHSTSRHVHFYFYAYTACNLRVDWREPVCNLRVAWREPVGNSPLAEPVNEPVDCMTCLVNMAREQDRADYFTNPCAEIELNK